MTGELHRIRTEGVRLQNLGTSLDVGLVNLLYQLRLADTQLVVAGANEHPAGIQHGSHGPVEHVNPAVIDEVVERRHAQRS